MPVAASDEERLRDKRFDALEPGELAAAVPADDASSSSPRRERRTRRAERDRRGERIDLRRTLRGCAAHRRRPDPARAPPAARRAAPDRPALRHLRLDGALRARVPAVPDAARARTREAFVFATRLTRITRALATRSPERAIQRAAAAAPDWSSGTRIGDALQRVQRPPRPPRHGARRGDRDPLRRLGARRAGAGRARDAAAGAARVPDRVGQPAREPRRASRRAPAGWPRRCRTSTRSSAATASRRCTRWSTRSRRARRRARPTPEPSRKTSRGRARRRSPGSSVAMPSGYGPSRGKTTPGWI